MKTQIAIIVQGGNVNAVLASDPNAVVELLDFDNAEANGPEATEALLAREEACRKTMTEVF